MQRTPEKRGVYRIGVAAGKVAAAKAIQEVYLFYNDEDEEEFSDYSVDAP